MNAGFHGNSLKVYRLYTLNIHQAYSPFLCWHLLGQSHKICSRSLLLSNGEWDLKLWSLVLQPAVLLAELPCLPAVHLLVCPPRTVSSSPRFLNRTIKEKLFMKESEFSFPGEYCVDANSLGHRRLSQLQSLLVVFAIE